MIAYILINMNSWISLQSRVHVDCNSHVARADFFPPELRREMLLENGERILLGTRDLEKDFVGEVVWLGGRRGGPKTARIVRELFGDEKSQPFRPSNSGSARMDITVEKAQGDDLFPFGYLNPTEEARDWSERSISRT